MYKADLVPVGEDQIPHVEITREIARRFNHFYGPVFPEPQAKLTETPRILGIDRRKMSKSYNNAIYLADSPEIILETAKKMITDPQRARKTDPGDPDVCNVFSFHKLYTVAAEVAAINTDCRKAGIGCIECKKKLAESLKNGLAPIQERRAYYVDRPQLVDDIIREGTDRARLVAQKTMDEVRTAIGI